MRLSFGVVTIYRNCGVNVLDVGVAVVGCVCCVVVVAVICVVVVVVCVTDIAVVIFVSIVG